MNLSEITSGAIRARVTFSMFFNILSLGLPRLFPQEPALILRIQQEELEHFGCVRPFSEIPNIISFVYLINSLFKVSNCLTQFRILDGFSATAFERQQNVLVEYQRTDVGHNIFTFVRDFRHLLQLFFVFSVLFNCFKEVSIMLTSGQGHALSFLQGTFISIFVTQDRMSFIVTAIKLILDNQQPEHAARPESDEPPDELFNGVN